MIIRFQLYYWVDLLLKDEGEEVVLKLGVRQLSGKKSATACRGTRLQSDLSSLRLC